MASGHDEERRGLRDWFESYEQQGHAANLGMWLFLTSEVLLFGALLGLYTAYRIDFSEQFHIASGHNNIAIGTTNTFVLVTSSFFVAWAIHKMRAGNRKAAVRWLALTAVFGLVFLVLKGVEYAQHFSHGIFPGRYYAFDELPHDGAKLFFTLYYFLTGLHALHVIGGITALLVLATMVHRGRMSPTYHGALENGGLYWHLVDLVWLFLWPLLYLAG